MMVVFDRETVALLLGVFVIASAVVLGLAGVVDGNSVVTLILVGLAITGFGRYRSKNFETVLFRALRAGRSVQPIIVRDDKNKKIVIYTLHGQVPTGLKHLANKLAKITGYELEFRSHEGVSLL